jgi:hypothetical protein
MNTVQTPTASRPDQSTARHLSDRLVLSSIALIASLFMPDVPLRARQPRQQPAAGEVPSSTDAAEPRAAVG